MSYSNFKRLNEDTNASSRLLRKIDGGVSGLDKIVWGLMKNNMSDKSESGIKDFFEKILDKDIETSGMIKTFVSDDETFNFYNKYSEMIDSKLRDIEYFEQSPFEMKIDSVRDYVIQSTRNAVTSSILSIKEELID